MNTVKIRFIVETMSTPDNRAHYAVITSTRTGRSLQYIADGPRNAAMLARRVTEDWDCLYCTEHACTVREFKHAAANVPTGYSNVVAADILALEEVRS